MSSVDLPPVLSQLPLVVISALILAISYWTVVRRPSFDQKSPPTSTSDWPVLGDLGFWGARREWWLQQLKQAKSNNFSFHVGKHRLVGTNSDEGRKLFFESKSLGFTEGYVRGIHGGKSQWSNNYISDMLSYSDRVRISQTAFRMRREKNKVLDCISASESSLS